MANTTVNTTEQAAEVQAKAETEFFTKLRKQISQSSTAVGIKINNFKSLQLQIAEKLTAGRNALGLKTSIDIKDLTKPKQILQQISLKSINWRATVSMATSWAKIYASQQNGVASVDLKNVIGAVNTKLMASTSVSKARVTNTTSRLDAISNAAYGNSRMWWAVRLANYRNFKSPFSKMRSGTEINLASQAAVNSALLAKKR